MKMRNISYLVAVVLVAIVTIALGVALYTYFHGWIGARTSVAAGPEGNLVIEGGNLIEDANKVILYVANIGQGIIDKLRVYVEDPQTSIITMAEVNTTIPSGRARKIEAFIDNIDVKPYEKYPVYVYTGSGSATFATLLAVQDPWLMVIGNETSDEELWRYTIDSNGYYYAVGYWYYNNIWYPFVVKIDPATKSVLWIKAYNFTASALVGGIHYLDIGYLLLTVADGRSLYLVLIDSSDGSVIGGWTVGLGIAPQYVASYSDGSNVYVVAGDDYNVIIAKFRIRQILWWIILSTSWAEQFNIPGFWIMDIYSDGTNVYATANDTIVVLSDANGNVVGAAKVPYMLFTIRSGNNGVYISGDGVVVKLSSDLSSVIWGVKGEDGYGKTFGGFDIVVTATDVIIYGERYARATLGSVQYSINNSLLIMTISDADGSISSVHILKLTRNGGYSVKAGYAMDIIGSADGMLYEIGNDYTGTLLWLNQTSLPNPAVLNINPSDLGLAPTTFTPTPLSLTPTSVSPSISSGVAVTETSPPFKVMIASG